MKTKIAALTIGGLIAAAIALLYAPSSGEKTRQMLGERSQQAMDKTRQFLQETQQSAGELVTRKARLAIDEASTILDHGKDTLTNARQKLAEEN